jgi:translation initiation factor IF-2
VGKEFRFYESKKDAEKSVLENNQSKGKEEEGRPTGEAGKKLLPIIIKADTVGSLEAIIHESKKLETEKIGLKISSQSVGDIGEADVKLARAFPGMLIVGFNVKTDSSARSLAERENIPIQTFNIIYELTEWVGQKLQENSPREEVDEITGKATILKIFSINKNKQVVGGRVEEGTIEANSSVKIFRREAEIGIGHIKELQSKKTKTGSVSEGEEFGALIDSKIEISSGDKIACIKRLVK